MSRFANLLLVVCAKVYDLPVLCIACTVKDFEACHSAKLKTIVLDVYAKAVEVKLDEARLF